MRFKIERNRFAGGEVVTADEFDAVVAERDKLRDAEHNLSNAYLRLRKILNAWNTPTAPTAEQVWAYVEAKATEIVAENTHMARELEAAEAEIEFAAARHCGWCSNPSLPQAYRESKNKREDRWIHAGNLPCTGSDVRERRFQRHQRNVRQDESRPRCSGCGSEIDPDVCWCGSSISHNAYEGHTAVEMGCQCHLQPQAWPTVD